MRWSLSQMIDSRPSSICEVRAGAVSTSSPLVSIKRTRARWGLRRASRDGGCSTVVSTRSNITNSAATPRARTTRVTTVPWNRFQGTVVTLVVLALGVAALFVMFERVETTVEHPPSLDARRNPHLALVRLMETRGLDVETAPALTSQMLEGRESIIWLSDQRIDLTQRAG